MTSTATILDDSQRNQLFLGIDGGGSKCRAKLTSGNETIGMGLAGRANPVHGLHTSIDSIIESTNLALKDAGLSAKNIGDVVAGIGLAGVNLQNLYDQVAEWQHPFNKLFLTTDLHIACLGAHNYKDGSIIITGTGSSGISVLKGETKIFGAHGFPIGDQGSGAWTGLSAIRAALLANDGLGPDTLLRAAVCKILDINCTSITERMSNQPPKEYARLAPLVFECADQGDEVAIGIVQHGADYISKLAAAIKQTNPNRLSLVGGLNKVLTPWLAPDIQAQLSEPLLSPLDGAIAFAQHNNIKPRA
ncbi:MAG: BadF/BadG/BcrA/BcrD ATPase family protein [Arenicellales bacterium]